MRISTRWRGNTLLPGGKFSPAAPAWACRGDLLLLLLDLPRGALTGGQRSCSGVESGDEDATFFFNKCDLPDQWFPVLGRLPAPPPSPQPDKASQSPISLFRK